MTDSPDNKRLLEKIKKCMALAKGNSNPNEAAAAMRQAQAMMRAGGLTEQDVHASIAADELVKTVEGFGKCVFLSRMRGLMRRTFGVNSVMELNPGSANRANIRYIGVGGKAKLAGYCHRVIQRAVDDDWKKFCAQYPEVKQKPKAKLAFRLGYLASVSAQVEAWAPVEAEDQAIAAFEHKLYGPKGLTVNQAKQRPPTVDDLILASHGRLAGSKFQLHRPMEAGAAGPAPRALNHDKGK